MDCAELVAVGITHIGQMHRPQAAFAQTRRVLDRFATVGNRSVVKLANFFGRVALKADGAAVGKGCLLAVDGLADAKGASVVPVKSRVWPEPAVLRTGSPAPSVPSTAL